MALVKESSSELFKYCFIHLYLIHMFFQYNLETETAPVVFIVSTTGDGEPPDNALKFVRNIMKKTLSSDHYEHISYALLGK